MHKRLWAWFVLLILLAAACGRYFHTPLQPASRQAEGMTINDDGSVTYALDRLSIELKPMTDAELNRLAPGPDLSNNPYTFGEWTAPGDEWTPPAIYRLSAQGQQLSISQGQDQPAQRAHHHGQHPAVRGAELRRIIPLFSLVLAGPHRPRAQDLSSPHGRAQADAVQWGHGL